MSERHDALVWFDRELKAIDPNLELVKAKEHAGAPGMRPGFWHARMTDPKTGWQHYMPLEGPDGQFSEPHSGHLRRLKESDLQRPRAFADLKRKWDAEDDRRKRDQLFAREDFRTEFMERYRNKERPSVSFARIGGWRNKAHAPRG